MSRHQKEEVPARPQTLAERALAEALATGDLRRREWLDTLDPRQREAIGMGD